MKPSNNKHPYFSFVYQNILLNMLLIMKFGNLQPQCSYTKASYLTEGLAQWLRSLPPNPEVPMQFDSRPGRGLNIWSYLLSRYSSLSFPSFRGR